jgi:hypothetical protein
MGGPTPPSGAKRRVAENPPANGFEGPPYAAAPVMPQTIPPGMPPEAAAAKRIAFERAASQAPLTPPDGSGGAGDPAASGSAGVKGGGGARRGSPGRVGRAGLP